MTNLFQNIKVGGVDVSGNILNSRGSFINFDSKVTVSGNQILTGFNSGIYITTGQTGNFYTSDNPSGYATTGYVNSVSGYLKDLINASSAGVSSLNSTSGALTINGTGNIVVSTNIPLGIITISGSGQDLSNYVTSQSTGTLTGTFYPLKSNPSGYISGYQNSQGWIGIGQSPTYFHIDSADVGNSNGTFGIGASQDVSIYPNANLLLSPVGKVGVKQSNPQYTFDVVGSGNFSDGLYVNGISVLTGSTNSFVTTGQTGAFYPTSNPSGYITGVNLSSYVLTSTLNNKINWTSGQAQSFVATISSGVDSQTISFPTPFTGGVVPYVQVTLEVPSTNPYTYHVYVSDRTTGQFVAQFSDTITETGNKLQIYASYLI